MGRRVDFLLPELLVGHHLGRIEFTEPKPHFQHAAQRLIDLTLGQQAFGHSAGEVAHVRRVVEVAADQDRSRRRFFERRVLAMARHEPLDRAAVGDDEPVELPLVAKQGLEQELVLGAWCSVDRVVRRHDGRRLAFDDARLEVWQEVLAQHALADGDVDLGSIAFFVVDGVVLQRGRKLQVSGIVTLRPFTYATVILDVSQGPRRRLPRCGPSVDRG